MAKGQVSIEATGVRERPFLLWGKLVIVDEVQNLFPGHVKTIVTRIGEGSKLVLLGDTSQIDTPTLSGRDNGFPTSFLKWPAMKEPQS
jgi:PhoH-like ATPase